LLGQGRDILAYIVLDHTVPLGVYIEGRDKHNKLYVRVSPSLCDTVGYQAPGKPGPLGGVPVYRRQDMPEGWGQEGEAI
jgi:hypothetical protein